MAIAVGSKLPAPPASLWENAPENSVTFPETGKIILLGVPGAFTPPCSSQIPEYIARYQEFADKGVAGIYVIAVNDIFCVKAWKEALAGGKDSQVHFCADSTGEYIKTLGLDFDASGLLGNHRSKRFAAVVENGEVKSLFVESEAPEITVTKAETVLGGL
ncbi:Redoxin [Pyronema domesticum]|uniref:Similar to Putative peroxiredoxin pmp20 acc. no. O14313 n=1 Tax=Pyronema omphalodes (strain CBS 100304) TaxID=1076935 RepID=U4KWA7_PYROM|nr:Redoxin [Pyronema domesticum]CCX05998.1 Similar to Putative peroxiredoxin pmp20; acc. no. O14313 [Pyronema omphalodes CBS 100304]